MERNKENTNPYSTAKDYFTSSCLTSFPSIFIFPLLPLILVTIHNFLFFPCFHRKLKTIRTRIIVAYAHSMIQGAISMPHIIGHLECRWEYWTLFFLVKILNFILCPLNVNKYFFTYYSHKKILFIYFIQVRFFRDCLQISVV